MKILFIIHSPNPSPGAAWIRISFFARYLKNLGHDVNILGAFSFKTINKAGCGNWNGIPLINLTPIIMTNNLISLAFNILSSLVTSIPLLLFLKSDVIIISVPPGESTLGSFIVAKILRKRIVIDYRDEWEDHLIGVVKSIIDKKAYSILKDIMSGCYRKSKLMMTVTSSLSNKLYLRGVKNIKIIPNGADCNYFKPFSTDNDRDRFRRSIGLNKEDFVLVYSGGIGVYYRIDIVLKAVKKAIPKIPNIKLIIIGYGSDMQIEELINLSKNLNIYDRVFFYNSKKDELTKLLACCDIGVVPYDSNPLWKNSLPVKSFEYFACGLPVIATVYKDSLLGKLIEENNIGIISNPDNIEALADVITKIYLSDLISARKRAVLFVRRYYDRNDTAKEFIKLLETLATL